MAAGGAWQSETFDNGQKTWPAEAAATMQQPTATPPPQMYNPPAGSHREAASFGTITLTLRVPQFLFSLIALAVMASNNGGSYYYRDFTRFKPYTGVVAMNAIVCFYALVQLVISVVNRSAVGSFASFPTTTNAILTFVFDAVLAFALMGVSAAAAAVIAYYEGIGCDSDDKFCHLAAVAIAMSFIAWAAVTAAAALYPVRLLRMNKR